MVPTLCQISTDGTWFGPAPTLVGVGLTLFWAIVLYLKQPVERLHYRLAAGAFLILTLSALLGYNGEGGQIGGTIATSVSQTPLAGFAFFLLVLAALASTPLATDWFFIPLYSRLQASRVLRKEPVRGTVGRYQVRGGFMHDDVTQDGEPTEAADAKGATDVAVMSTATLDVPETEAGPTPVFETPDPNAELADLPVARPTYTEREGFEHADHAEEEVDEEIPWYARRSSRRHHVDEDTVETEVAVEEDELAFEVETEEPIAEPDAGFDGTWAVAPAPPVEVMTDNVPVQEVQADEETELDAEQEVALGTAVEEEVEEEADTDLEEDSDEETDLEYDDEEELDEDVGEEDLEAEDGEGEVLAAADEEEDEEEEEADDGWASEADVEDEEEEAEEAVVPDTLATADEVSAEDELAIQTTFFESEEPSEEDVVVGDDEFEAPSDPVADSGVPVELEAPAQAIPPAPAVAPTPSELIAERERNPDDVAFFQAGDLVVSSQRASISFLQRSLGIGYFQAAKLLDRLEKESVIGAYTGAVNREVLMATSDWEARKEI